MLTICHKVGQWDGVRVYSIFLKLRLSFLRLNFLYGSVLDMGMNSGEHI